jgi:CheY-like chemotaxis protein
MPERVLVVEDDRDVRESLMFVLESEGYGTVGAADGREALTTLAAPDSFCVILLDLMMPVMDGWAFRVAQQKDSAIARIPVIVVSALAATTDRSRLDARGYVSKPVVFDELLGLVRRVCPLA